MTLILLLLLLSEHLDIIDITDSCRCLKSARITRPEIPTNRQPVRQRTRLILFSFSLLLSLVKLVSINLMVVVFITCLFVFSADFLHSVLVIAVILLLLIIQVSFVHFLIVVYFIFFFVSCLLLVVLLELDLVVRDASLLHPILSVLLILISFPLLLLFISILI